MSLQPIDKTTAVYKCGYCKKVIDQTILKCNRCQLIFYCTVNCKTIHWTKHKKVCKKKATQIKKPENKCDNCGTVAQKLQQCARCRNVFYCSKECQTEKWPKHKEVCQIKSAEKEEKKEAERPFDVDADIEKAFETCWACKKTAEKIIECEKCHAARYCNVSCKDKDAPLHNRVCEHFFPDKYPGEMTKVRMLSLRLMQETFGEDEIEAMEN